MTAADPPDHVLLAAWRSGETSAGDALVQRHFRAVYRFFAGKVSDEAEELTQRTFLVCVEAKERISETRRFRAYLFGIARNLLLQHYERRRPLDKDVVPHEASLHDLGLDNPRGLITAREEQRLLLTALARLPLDTQLTLELHYWWGMAINQIAEITEVPPGTVKSRLHRGRVQLRETIEGLEAEPAARAATLRSAERFVSGADDGGAPD